jgi:hypothetical protein
MVSCKIALIYIWQYSEEWKAIFTAEKFSLVGGVTK